MAQSELSRDSNSQIPILSLPWSERERIVVVDDALAEIEREAVQHQDVAAQNVDWGKIAGKALAAVLRVTVTILAGYFVLLALLFVITFLIVLTYGAIILIAIIPVLRWRQPILRWLKRMSKWLRWPFEPIVDLNKLRKTHQLGTEGVKVLSVSRSEAKSLVFPPGHPRGKILYIGHPLRPPVYYSAAAFHRFLFEDKVSEAFRLLQYLGATRIEVENQTGWGREFASNLNLPLDVPGVQVGAEVGSTKKSGAQIRWQATFDNTTGTSPALPEDLVWYYHEPTWQQVAEGRLKGFGLKNFNLYVGYEEDFGVNSELNLLVSQVGLDMGGTFVNHESTTWRISGTFG